MLNISCAGILRKNKSVLLLQRSLQGGNPGKWEFPGGKAEIGETPAEALVREFQEELNLGITVGNAIFRTSFQTQQNKKYDLYVYEVAAVSGTLHIQEHQSYQWLDVTNLLKQDLLDSDRKIAEYLTANNYFC